FDPNASPPTAIWFGRKLLMVVGNPEPLNDERTGPVRVRVADPVSATPTFGAGLAMFESRTRPVSVTGPARLATPPASAPASRQVSPAAAVPAASTALLAYSVAVFSGVIRPVAAS